MTFNSCSREKEVAELLRSGHWPLACSPELLAHVSECRRCSDRVLVTQSFQQDRIASERVARLNSPGLVWWRAQLRGRSAALENIAKPIKGAQLFALLVNVVVAAGLVISQVRHGARWPSLLSELPRSQAFHFQAFHLTTLWSFSSMTPDWNWNLMVLIPGVGALALLSGVVLYLALERR
jgi:hypothetical protein